MYTLDVTIHFEEQEPLVLNSPTWFSSTLKSWRLVNTEVRQKFDFQWNFLWAELTISAEEFIELVGKDEEKALEIILHNAPFLSKKEARAHITHEVKQFYDLLRTQKLVSVDLKLTDQS